ncbi:hypothetical protein [Mucilaginibacter ginsenosidivorans]|uniref:Uncharacterized protein n=1 Tax=Mucilaginibacter ginsenosidivorans TaxID=398053 RepID=A0A5B8V0A0_9SPHI|nr:hypothetical protein [Mucilaginibacter ginsenosidivorans]QEC64465.1 hypothetical protein FRZ54_18415 [Mucilaginibacter ginsenosidivorans]
MKSDLDLVIAALEAEKRSIQKMMKQSMIDYDYLIVYHHSEALMKLESRLNKLYTFKDPLHNRRQELKRQERSLKKPPEYFRENKTLWKFFTDRQIEELKKNKLDLESQSQKKVIFNDSQQIDDLIFDIVARKIDKFQIVFGIYDDDDVQIIFKTDNDFLLICINMFDPEEPDFVFDGRISDPLKGLGFKFDADRESFVYKYNLQNFKDATEIKILLSRLFFDVFGISGVGQLISVIYPLT